MTALVRPELQAELSAALYNAFEKGAPTLSAFVPVAFNGTLRRVAVLVQPRQGSTHPEPLALVMFLEDGKIPPAEEAADEGTTPPSLVRRLREELRQTQARLRTGREEFEATSAELHAANEELQSINEEYRSTTEELETSKEELHSMNEELQTVNNELKNKLEEISRAHSDLENLIAATEIGTLFLDRSLRIHRFTPPVTRLFPLTSGDYNRPITDFTYHLDYDRLEADAHQVLRSFVPIEHEAKSQEGQWYLVRLRPYRTGNDRIGGVVVTFVDITTRKTAEEALRRSEARFRTLVEASAQIVWTTNRRGEAVEDSPSWRAFTGQSDAERQGEGWAQVVHPDDRAQALKNWRQSVKAESPFETEFRLYHAPSGNWRWTAVRAVPLRDETGAVRGWVGMNSDITEQKQTEEALAQQAYQLQEQDRHRTEFLSLLGHELRNPLAAIYTTLESLNCRREGTQAAHLQQGIDLIGRQVKHLLRLVDDLLNVTRISRGHIQLKKERIDLAGQITRAVELIRPQIEAGHYKLKLNLPQSPLHLEADPERITQIVANLLSNATHYTEEGGQITLTVQRVNDEALIRIRDTGIGFTPEQLPHLFEPFQRPETDTGEHPDGLGLGLPLASKLAELHGGRLEAFSAGPGQGSEFTVRLPALSEREAAEKESLPPARTPADTDSRVSPRRILVVEDEEDVAESLAILLQALGHTVRIVSRGGQTLEAVREFHPELVLLDLGLPDMSGYEVARRLRQEPGLGTLPLVALSGYGQREDVQKAQAAGFDRHLLKPAGVEALQAVLKES